MSLDETNNEEDEDIIKNFEFLSNPTIHIEEVILVIQCNILDFILNLFCNRIRLVTLGPSGFSTISSTIIAARAVVIATVQK